MLVKCLNNQPNHNLIVGKDYVVYGMMYSDDTGLSMMLAGEDYTYYPLQYPIRLFEIIDDTMPSCWRANWYIQENGVFAISYPEWFDMFDHWFRITEGYEEDVEVWKKYKELMDNEARGKK